MVNTGQWNERARDTGGDQIKLVQHGTRAGWNSVLNRNGAASMALSDPAITKWLSPSWPADLPSLHRNPIICYLRTEWIRNRYAEKFIESITGASSSSAERSDESATRKVLLICDLQRSPVTFYAGFILVILFGAVMRHQSCLKPVSPGIKLTARPGGYQDPSLRSSPALRLGNRRRDFPDESLFYRSPRSSTLYSALT